MGHFPPHFPLSPFVFHYSRRLLMCDHVTSAVAAKLLLSERNQLKMRTVKFNASGNEPPQAQRKAAASSPPRSPPGVGV